MRTDYSFISSYEYDKRAYTESKTYDETTVKEQETLLNKFMARIQSFRKIINYNKILKDYLNK